MNKILAICCIVGIGLTACNNESVKEEALAKEAALKQVKDSLALDSFRKAEIAKKEAQERMRLDQEMSRNRSQTSNTNYQDVEYDAGNESTSQPVVNNKKKGWSDAAKGTAVGAGVGAGVGALIDKDKRLRGAAIGAAIGGAGGYAVGRKSDRKSGRVQKK